MDHVHSQESTETHFLVILNGVHMLVYDADFDFSKEMAIPKLCEWYIPIPIQLHS